MFIPNYSVDYLTISSTNKNIILPSQLEQQTKQTKSSQAVCYYLPDITSDIAYFLEYDVGINDIDDDAKPDDTMADYGIIALYTTKNNQHLLFDLENDIYIRPAKEFDQLIKNAHITEQIEKHTLVNFCNDYVYSNGFNAKDRLEHLLIFNHEEERLHEINQITDKYDQYLCQ